MPKNKNKKGGGGRREYFVLQKMVLCYGLRLIAIRLDSDFSQKDSKFQLQGQMRDTDILISPL